MPSPVVRLRKPVPEDIKARMRLGFSAEINRMYGALTESAAQTSQEQAEQFYRNHIDHPNAWMIEVDGQLAGHTSLNGLVPADARARLGIGLLNERFLGRGIGRQAVAFVLHHAFDVLHLHRVDLRVLSYNTRAIRCYLACGFRHEGTERESAHVGDEWYDDWIMAILEPEYRALQVSRL